MEVIIMTMQKMCNVQTSPETGSSERETHNTTK